MYETRSSVFIKASKWAVALASDPWSIVTVADVIESGEARVPPVAVHPKK